MLRFMIQYMTRCNVSVYVTMSHELDNANIDNQFCHYMKLLYLTEEQYKSVKYCTVGAHLRQVCG